MNIFFHELKVYRKSIIIWSCSMTLLSVMYILIFKEIGPDIESFKTYLDNMPDAIKKIFNICISSISTLEGFYTFIFSFVALCGSIQAMNIGTDIVSKEIRENTADFLIAKPLSRTNIMTSKLIAALSALIITNIIYLAFTILSAFIAVSHFNLKLFFMISITLFFMQLIFLALGIMISVLVRKIKSVISVSLSTVFGFYILGSLGAIIGEERVRYFSPFRYFDSVYILQHSSYELSYMFIGIVFFIGAITASYLVFLKKDIHSI